MIRWDLNKYQVLMAVCCILFLSGIVQAQSTTLPEGWQEADISKLAEITGQAYKNRGRSIAHAADATKAAKYAWQKLYSGKEVAVNQTERAAFLWLAKTVIQSSPDARKVQIANRLVKRFVERENGTEPLTGHEWSLLQDAMAKAGLPVESRADMTIKWIEKSEQWKQMSPYCPTIQPT